MERSKEIAVLAERVGYDHLWVYDHVETVPRRERRTPSRRSRCWPRSRSTRADRLGQLVTCRPPRLLAKEAACVDVYSGGRLILGLGAGWYEREYQAYGYPYLGAGARLDVLDETLQVVKRLWTEETVSFAGKYQFDGAYCDPKPIQKLPPIWVGGGGEKKTLRIAARHADATNWQTGLSGFVHKSEILREHCEAEGRAFDSIVRTHGPDCRLFDSESDLHSPGGGIVVGPRQSRRIRARQLRRHGRAGDGEGAGLRRRRLCRVRALVPRLPVVGEPRALHGGRGPGIRG